ncbi:MAG: hypothetical protein H0T66_12595 [Geodermatophilaceae bacterium]|nr:hypothetical protein [Geodermatophilaceae bacterium]
MADLIDRALAGGRFFAESVDLVPWCLALIALAHSDRVDAARAEIDRARVGRRGPASPAEYAFFCISSGSASWRAGDVRLTEREGLAGLEALSGEDSDVVTMSLSASCTHMAVLASLERGDLATASGLLHRFDDRWPEPPAVLSLVRMQRARVAEALARDEPTETLRLARSLADADLRSGAENPATSWRAFAVLALLRLGEHEQAAELAQTHLARAREWGAPSDVGGALRLRARTDPDRRAALLDEAVAVLEFAPDRLQRAWTLADLGEFYRVTRRRSEAREVLRRAAELGHACGSGVLQARVVDALAALGDRPRSMMFTGLESLTASERRVADLAGAGRSNRDIAQDLFVSPKTVENHLGRVYVKLGICGRRELAHVLA